jgi:glycine/betaine/sarcosine/D-proline reductase family selenoprotein B
MAKEMERRGLPVALISAIPMIPLGAGANRVVRGVAVEHVCGDPGLSDAADRELRRRIVATALCALRTPVDGPTLFDPSAGEAKEPIDAA